MGLQRKITGCIEHFSIFEMSACIAYLQEDFLSSKENNIHFSFSTAMTI